MNFDARDLSQVFIDAYYEWESRREFIAEIHRKFPDMDITIIEAIWFIIDFMNMGASRRK